ncbi:metallophosphoesterase [Candidatus Woesearchaeota archaeon]|nr:metallophosphoesterase [Candidatus Woesearchaeota archaeon]MBW3005972.1 metallophosphoesterase [Candidatus Woesearchaeota archaeon]
MVYAVISDTHANREATQVVLADIQEKGITEVYCIGDIIGYGPDPYACTQDVRKHCQGRITKGNHELALQRVFEGKSLLMHNGPKQGIEHANKKLWKSQKKFLISLPAELQEGTRLFVHGNPAPDLPKIVSPKIIDIAKINDYIISKDDYVGRSRVEYTEGGLRQMSLQIYDEAKINSIFDVMRKKGVQTCFTGHLHVAGCIGDYAEENLDYVPEIMLAHRPLLDKTPKEPETFTFEKEPDKICLVFCGSVGQPRDRDNRASYVIVEDDKIIWRRLPYDFEKTIQKMKLAGLPEKQAERLRYGKYPDDEGDLEELLKDFED